MRRLSSQVGYLLLDVLVGLGLLGFVLLAIYQLYGSTFAVSRDINSRLATQQDVRLALDRVAGALGETTSAFGRLRVYAAETGCAGAYEGCLGFVTARSSNCAGTFQLVDGAPNWQATLYLWRDTASNELRLRCDSGSTFPVVTWPPPTLEPYAIIATRVVAATFTLQPADSLHPASIAIALQEQAATSSSRRPGTFFNQTIFLPQNR